jgi:hypothetical protein
MLLQAPDTQQFEIQDLKTQIDNLNALLNLENPIVIEQGQTIESLQNVAAQLQSSTRSKLLIQPSFIILLLSRQLRDWRP